MAIEVGKVYRLSKECNAETRGRLVRVTGFEDGFDPFPIACVYVDTGVSCWVDERALDEVLA